MQGVALKHDWQPEKNMAPTVSFNGSERMALLSDWHWLLLARPHMMQASVLQSQWRTRFKYIYIAFLRTL